MSACLYECSMMHRRLKPAQKRFDYRIFMLSVDLNDLPKVPFLGLNRFNLFALNDRDHIDLGKPGGIRANLITWMAQKDIECPPDALIQLVTLPRVLGYAFNPVSFYYVNSRDGEPLFAIAEVRNTYHEMKLYLVDGEKKKGWQRKIAKEFYVSPFSDVRDSFDFKLGLPDETWTVNIDNLDQEGITLISAIQGKARPLTARRLLWFSLKYPLLSLKVIFGIHWQALKLWLHKAPYFPKATHTKSQRDVLRPHSSLTSSDE
ncbi:MAG: DUF1365 family protein [Akkermansiaceae bacterium]|jgi:DUF1365 family protein